MRARLENRPVFGCNKYTEEYTIIILDSKSAVCMDKNGKETNHTMHIERRVKFSRNGEKWKMQKIDWCEGGLQLAEIATNNVGENNLNTIIRYIMVRLENWGRTLVQEGLKNIG